MGAWGEEPWDNDAAADWFGDLWDSAPIVDRVIAGLNSVDGDAVRAALWLCSQLCRVYVWPVDRLDETLDAAIQATDRLLAREDEDRLLDLWHDEGVDLTPEIEAYRSTFAARRT